MTEHFAPWTHGSATRMPDGSIVGTIALKADSGLRIVNAEVVHDGTMLTCVFVPVPLCVCGHSASDHFREERTCMFSTDEEAWACDCTDYRPRPPE